MPRSCWEVFFKLNYWGQTIYLHMQCNVFSTIVCFICLNYFRLCFLLSSFAQLLPSEITHLHLLYFLSSVLAGLHFHVMARTAHY
jgi:hypothetical protein